LIGCTGTAIGYSCTGSNPSVCNTVCGDGVVIASNETCDDQNTASSDGCSSSCTTEFGFLCSGAPSVCTTTCGDGKKASSEQCDDGSNDGIGCLIGCTGPAVGY